MTQILLDLLLKRYRVLFYKTARPDQITADSVDLTGLNSGDRVLFYKLWQTLDLSQSINAFRLYRVLFYKISSFPVPFLLKLSIPLNIRFVFLAIPLHVVAALFLSPGFFLLLMTPQGTAHQGIISPIIFLVFLPPFLLAGGIRATCLRIFSRRHSETSGGGQEFFVAVDTSFFSSHGKNYLLP